MVSFSVIVSGASQAGDAQNVLIDLASSTLAQTAFIGAFKQAIESDALAAQGVYTAALPSLQLASAEKWTLPTVEGLKATSAPTSAPSSPTTTGTDSVDENENEGGGATTKLSIGLTDKDDEFAWYQDWGTKTIVIVGAGGGLFFLICMCMVRQKCLKKPNEKASRGGGHGAPPSRDGCKFSSIGADGADQYDVDKATRPKMDSSVGRGGVSHSSVLVDPADHRSPAPSFFSPTTLTTQEPLTGQGLLQALEGHRIQQVPSGGPGVSDGLNAAHGGSQEGEQYDSEDEGGAVIHVEHDDEEEEEAFQARENAQLTEKEAMRVERLNKGSSRHGGEEEEEEEEEDDGYDEGREEQQADDFAMQACTGNSCVGSSYTSATGFGGREYGRGGYDAGSGGGSDGSQKPSPNQAQSQPTDLESLAIRCIFGTTKCTTPDTRTAKAGGGRRQAHKETPHVLLAHEKGNSLPADRALREEDVRDELSSALCITRPGIQRSTLTHTGAPPTGRRTDGGGYASDEDGSV
jgi:hypothetical protein